MGRVPGSHSEENLWDGRYCNGVFVKYGLPHCPATFCQNSSLFQPVNLFTSVFFGLIPESTLVHSTSILELSMTVFSIDQKPKHPLVPTQPSGCHESTWWEKWKCFSVIFKVHFVSVVGKFKRIIVKIDTRIIFKMPYPWYLALCFLQVPAFKGWNSLFGFVSWRKVVSGYSLSFRCIAWTDISAYTALLQTLRNDNILFNSLGESDSTSGHRSNYLLSWNH